MDRSNTRQVQISKSTQERKKHHKEIPQVDDGYSDTQIQRLIQRKSKTGVLRKKERTQPTFTRTYTVDDIALLLEVDNAENRRTGAALKKTFYDMYHLYKDVRFKRLATISVSHIYNLRISTIIVSVRLPLMLSMTKARSKKYTKTI